MSGGNTMTDLELQTLEAEALALARAIHRKDEQAAAGALVVMIEKMHRRNVLDSFALGLRRYMQRWLGEPVHLTVQSVARMLANVVPASRPD